MPESTYDERKATILAASSRTWPQHFARIFLGEAVRDILGHKRLQHVTDEQMAEEAVTVFLSGRQNQSGS